MKKLIILFLLIIPFAATAQRDLFMKEFNGVNNWFFSRPQIRLVQKYSYYNDTASSVAIDSAICTIIKKNTAIDYKAGGLESFSDSGYMVKISHADKYMVISKIKATDTAQVRAILNQGFGSFNVFTKNSREESPSDWNLSGGTAGVNSARLVMDLKGHKIKYIEIFMAPNHPLISPFKKAGGQAVPVIIKVDYQYTDNGNERDVAKLSDFITVSADSITPSEKYKAYRIKLAPEKK